jgi:hypothetical protein
MKFGMDVMIQNATQTKILAWKVMQPLRPLSLHFIVSLLTVSPQTDSEGYLWISLNELANNDCYGLAGAG